MNVVFCLNKNYFPHLEVVLKSLFYHHNNVDVYIIFNDEDFPVEELQRIQSKIQPFNGIIHFLYLPYPPTKDGSFPLVMGPSYINNVALLRLFLGRVLPDHIEKILYLDCDLIINRPIDELWNTSLEGYMIAAISDIGQQFDWGLDCIMEYTQSYVNSGVMLINLVEWRNKDIAEQFIHVAEEYGDKVKYCDQDVINLTLKGQINQLPIRFNLQTGLMEYHPDYDFVWEFEPVIVHYTSRKKPWLTGEDGSKFFSDLYWKYHDMDWDNLRSS